VLRADSGFCRDELMSWAEQEGIDYVIGVAKTSRLVAEIEAELAAAQEDATATGRPARRFKDFMWTTRESWSAERRVVAKAEWTHGEANPRFIVTSLPSDCVDARTLYTTSTEDY
jgi:cobalamin-dependent methionine synthase I